LATRDVLGVRDRVVHDADAADDSSERFDFASHSGSNDVVRAADNHPRLDNILPALHACNLPVLTEVKLIDLGVEHEGSSSEGALPSETLWDTGKPIDGVDKGRVAVGSGAVHVEKALLNDFHCLALHELVVSVEGDGMADEVDGVRRKTKLLDHSQERLLIQVHLLERLLILLVKLLNKLKEVLALPLLIPTHEITLQRLCIIRGDLADLRTTLGENSVLLDLIHVGAINWAPLEISGNLRLQEHLDKLA